MITKKLFNQMVVWNVIGTNVDFNSIYKRNIGGNLLVSFLHIKKDKENNKVMLNEVKDFFIPRQDAWNVFMALKVRKRHKQFTKAFNMLSK